MVNWVDVETFKNVGYLVSASLQCFYKQTYDYEITVYKDGALSIDNYTEEGLVCYYYKPLKSAKQFNKILSLHGAFEGLI